MPDAPDALAAARQVVEAVIRTHYEQNGHPRERAHKIAVRDADALVAAARAEEREAGACWLEQVAEAQDNDDDAECYRLAAAHIRTSQRPAGPTEGA